MKLKKIELNFGDLMSLNSKLKKGAIESMVINEELGELVLKKIESIARIGKKSYQITTINGLVKNQEARMLYKINKGWTIIEISAHMMGDVLCINKENGDTNKIDKYFFKVC